MKLENTNSETENNAENLQYSLYENIKSRDIKKLKKMLHEVSDRIDINQPDWNGSGNAPILDVTLQGDVEMVR